MIFKVVLFVLVCYVLYRLFMNDRKKSADQEVKEQKKRMDTGEMVQDPICGTYVDKENAISVRNGDQVTYFCSYECRQKYLDHLEEQRKLD
ncbi:transcriptional regulator [uncultured Mailhella sp.]|uniref:transcriptional regulator n=1 Tax=uncultured Mailhella sp. TaxID=1981031 RepID=UPI0026237113|nr:transcriptional regulator [uncultured Mailhella sp.]